MDKKFSEMTSDERMRIIQGDSFWDEEKRKGWLFNGFGFIFGCLVFCGFYVAFTMDKFSESNNNYFIIALGVAGLMGIVANYSRIIAKQFNLVRKMDRARKISQGKIIVSQSEFPTIAEDIQKGKVSAIWSLVVNVPLFLLGLLIFSTASGWLDLELDVVFFLTLISGSILTVGSFNRIAKRVDQLVAIHRHGAEEIEKDEPSEDVVDLSATVTETVVDETVEQDGPSQEPGIIVESDASPVVESAQDDDVQVKETTSAE